MENKKIKNNLYTSLAILSIIVIIVSSILVYQHNLKDTSINNTINKENDNNTENDVIKENENNETLPNEKLSQTEMDALNNYFNDLLNSQMTYISFMEPSKLLNVESDEYLEYIVSRSKYATLENNEHIPEYSITLNNIKKTLKELTNFDYSDNQIKERFKTFYNKKENIYIFLGGGAGAIPEIESSYKIGNEYYLKLSNSSNVVLRKVNEKYYFYSCQIKDSFENDHVLKNVEIKNTAVKELYNYIAANLNSNYVCLGYYYQNPFKNHTLEDKISLVLINYASQYKKKIDDNFLKKIPQSERDLVKNSSEYYIDVNDVKNGMKLIFNIEIEKFNDNTHYSWDYRSDANAFVEIMGGGGYDAKPIQQIIEYNELKDEINLTVVKAELGYDDNVYRYINNEKTKVFENVSENFKFTNENIDKFPQIKYVFKKNNNGQYYVSDIINLNFEQDFEDCK